MSDSESGILEGDLFDYDDSLIDSLLVPCEKETTNNAEFIVITNTEESPRDQLNKLPKMIQNLRENAVRPKWTFAVDIQKYSAATMQDPGRQAYYRVIQVFRKLFRRENVDEFCRKLHHVVNSKDEAPAKKFVVFFWIRVENRITKILNENLSHQNLMQFVFQILDCDDPYSIVAQIIEKISAEKSKRFLTDLHSPDNVHDLELNRSAERQLYVNFISCLELVLPQSVVNTFCQLLSGFISEENDLSVHRKSVNFWKAVLKWIDSSSLERYYDNLVPKLSDLLVENFMLADLQSCARKIVACLKICEQRRCPMYFFTRSLIEDTTVEENMINAAYSKFVELLCGIIGDEAADEFSSELLKAIEKFEGQNVAPSDETRPLMSEDYAKISLSCKRLVVLWDNIMIATNNISSVGLMMPDNRLADRLMGLLEVCFDLDDFSLLATKILNNIKANKYDKAQLECIFIRTIFEEKPSDLGRKKGANEIVVGSEELKRLFYSFIQRLNVNQTSEQESVLQFIDDLQLHIKSTEGSVAQTILEIFWTRTECMLRDEFPGCCFEDNQKILPELNNILEDTFNRDNCLAKFSKHHRCCDCGCIGRAKFIHKCYYRRIYSRSKFWRRNCTGCAGACDSLCSRVCNELCMGIGIVVVVLAIFGIIYYVYYFKNEATTNEDQPDSSVNSLLPDSTDHPN